MVLSSDISTHGPKDASVTGRSAAATSFWRGLKAGALFLSLVISAGLMAVALASPKYPWVAWITLVPLLFVIRVLTARSALACGALWGSALYLISTTMVGTGIPATIRSLVLLTAVPAIYTYLGALLTRHVGFSALSLAFGWIGVELALKPLGLRGGLLAGTQVGDGTFLSLAAGMLGYVCVAFVIAYVNALLFAVLSHVCRKAGSGSRLASRSGDDRKPVLPDGIARLACSSHSCPAQPRAPPAPGSPMSMGTAKRLGVPAGSV